MFSRRLKRVDEEVIILKRLLKYNVLIISTWNALSEV